VDYIEPPIYIFYDVTDIPAPAHNDMPQKDCKLGFLHYWL